MPILVASFSALLEQIRTQDDDLSETEQRLFEIDRVTLRSPEQHPNDCLNDLGQIGLFYFMYLGLRSLFLPRGELFALSSYVRVCVYK